MRNQAIAEVSVFFSQMRETVKGFVQKELAPFADHIDKTDDWDRRKVGLAIPLHHSAAAFTVTSSGAPNPFTPFKYSAILLKFTGA